MKSFAEYLTESHKTYKFRVKIAGEAAAEQVDRLENKLERFGLESISKPKTTPIQEHPQGFSPNIKNTEVNIIDVETAYPTTPQELTQIVSSVFETSESHIQVINQDHPEEIRREQELGQTDEEYEPVVGTEYEESDVKHKEHYGDEYNEKFIKDQETRKYEFAKK